jgi:hypothetical protein
MVIEIENKSNIPLTVKDTHYRLESERDNLKTGQLKCSGGLASGNPYDLFPEAWKTVPVSPIVLQTGRVHRVRDQPSDYSATLLGLPPRDGLRVRAQIHMHLELEGGARFETPRQGIPFTFEWLYPDDAGFGAMRTRFKKLLLEPEHIKLHQGYILGTYLQIAEVAQAATQHELLAALSKRQEPFVGRQDIALYVGKHYPKDPAVIAWYSERLQAKDLAALSDLRLAVLWDASFVQLITGLYESETSRCPDALSILHQHRKDWDKDAGVIKRLSAAVRKDFAPLLETKVADLDVARLEAWAYGVELLAMTVDQRAIELLRPALDDKRVFRGTGRLATCPGNPPPALRPCDCALDAVLTLLDGSPVLAYAKAGFHKLPIMRLGPELDAALIALRDPMIADLKHRLAAREKISGPAKTPTP